MTTPAVLSARGIVKRFPGVLALDGVDLTVRAGEAVAVIGENGAGKSTLMKVLAGIHAPDEGELRIDGRPLHLRGVREAIAAGIALIHQELNLADNLDVGANIFLGREPRRCGWIDRARIERESRALLVRVGLDIPPHTPTAALAIGPRQLVEIARALGQEARFLILDEPTSSLSAAETERLMELCAELRRDGTGIVYISHRLGEVSRVADRVVVLRDGRRAGELSHEEIDRDRMVRWMVGRDLDASDRVGHVPGDTVLEVVGLRLAPAGPTIDLTARSGEIVGLAGLVGAGRTELLESIFGVRARTSGTVRVFGREVPAGNPRRSVAAGLALVPEERGHQGLVLDGSVRENIALPGWRRFSRRGLAIEARARAESARVIESLDIRTSDDRRPAGTLSGGNQQKVVLGKWLPLEPRVLLLDEPTRGVDVGARLEIHRRLAALAGDGLAILFASSEMEEVLALADRLLVMHDGRIAGELLRDELSEEAVLQLATGGGQAA